MRRGGHGHKKKRICHKEHKEHGEKRRYSFSNKKLRPESPAPTNSRHPPSPQPKKTVSPFFSNLCVLCALCGKKLFCCFFSPSPLRQNASSLCALCALCGKKLFCRFFSLYPLPQVASSLCALCALCGKSASSLSALYALCGKKLFCRFFSPSPLRQNASSLCVLCDLCGKSASSLSALCGKKRPPSLAGIYFSTDQMHNESGEF